MITTAQQRQAEQYGREKYWDSCGFVVGNGIDPPSQPIAAMGVKQKPLPNIGSVPVGLFNYGFRETSSASAEKMYSTHPHKWGRSHVLKRRDEMEDSKEITKESLDVLFSRKKDHPKYVIWYTTDEKIRNFCEAYGLSEDQVRKMLQE